MICGIVALLTIQTVLHEDVDLKQAIIEPQTMWFLRFQQIFFVAGVIYVLLYWLSGGMAGS